MNWVESKIKGDAAAGSEVQWYNSAEQRNGQGDLWYPVRLGKLFYVFAYNDILKYYRVKISPYFLTYYSQYMAHCSHVFSIKRWHQFKGIACTNYGKL